MTTRDSRTSGGERPACRRAARLAQGIQHRQVTCGVRLPCPHPGWMVPPSQAGGLPDISRGLRSAATIPPGTRPNDRTTLGRVADLLARATVLAHLRRANVISIPAGGIASLASLASLDPRLIS